MLAEVIKRTGAGLPLEEMVKDSGIKIEEPPEYYQGLTVYGKKRSDWADAGRRTVTRSTGMTDSPLLYAAQVACLESVEWFLSDAPLRCYLEFTASKAAQDDKRLINLGQAPGGFEGAISRWLSKNSDLALLNALDNSQDDKALPVIKYLLKVAPESISAKGEDKLTPILSAVKQGRIEAVKILVANGVDQSKRHESTYANLLHAALFYSPKAAELEEMLNILDPDALAHMFCERTHHASWSESRTPLHSWLECALSNAYNGCYGPGHAYSNADEVIAVMRVLLSHSGGRELNIIDSAGDTLLHMLVRKQKDPVFLTALLEAIPRELAMTLLYRENAVGATPLEAAYDQFLSWFVVVRNDYVRQYSSLMVSNWAKTPAREFVEQAEEGRKLAPVTTRITTNKNDALKRAEETLAALDAFIKGEQGKRQLVSLNEANDVARRIGHGFQNQRYPVKLNKTPEDIAKEKEEAEQPKTNTYRYQPVKQDPAMRGFETATLVNTSWKKNRRTDDSAEADAEVDAMVAKLFV